MAGRQAPRWSFNQGGPQRTPLQKVIYWGAVAGVWGLIFVVAIFIAYLAAQASQTPPGDPTQPPPMVAFTATFGPGFYWFAAYCLFSLASQQFTHRWFGREASA